MESKPDISSEPPDSTVENSVFDDDLLPKKRMKDFKSADHQDNDMLKNSLDTGKEGSTPVKKKKNNESDLEEVPMTSNSKIQLAASIFGDSRPLADIDNRKLDFEPAEQREKYFGSEEGLIRDNDIPERLQRVFKNRESPSEAELSLEVDWIFNRIQLIKNIECPNSLKSKINQFLCFYRIEKYEIPFISRYRINILKPELDCDLWELYSWDKEWGYLYQTKQSMKSLYESSEKNRKLLCHGKEIDSNAKVLTNKCTEIERELTTYPINYIYSISDLEEYFKVHIYTYVKGKKSLISCNALQEIRKSNITSFTNAAALTPIQFSENLAKGSIIHMPCKMKLTPHELAFELISSTYFEELQIISAACLLMKTELAALPSVRSYIRDLYLKYVKIYTSPTEKGMLLLGVFHPYYRVKNIAQGKYVDTWSPDIWAEVLKCEEQGLINVKFKLPWKCEMANREDKILKAIEKYYLGKEEDDIESDWNLFRIQVLKQALEQIYEDTVEVIRKNMALKAKECIKLEVQKSFYSLISQGTFVKNNGKVIAFVTDPNAHAFGSSCLALLNEYGELIDEFTLGTLAVKKPEDLADADKLIWMKDKCTVAKTILDHRPDAIAIAANSLQSLVLRENVMGIIEKLQIENFNRIEFGFEVNERFLLKKLIPVLMMDPQVPRLFACSQRSKRLIPDRRMLSRMAISTARMLQNPCAETLSLGADPNELQIKYLNLHPLQSLLSETEYLSAIEIVSIEYISQCGVELNKIIQREHLLVILNFVPGLGPIKAQSLVHCLRQKLKKGLKTRAELKDKQFLGQRVYENVSSFIKIAFERQENNALDSTRIHPESYDLAMLLAKSVFSGLHIKDEDLIIEVMSKPDKLHDLDLKAYAKVYMDHTGINIEETLECIVSEIKNPYLTTKKTYKDISPQNIMYLVTGETKNTLEKGRIVYAIVMCFDVLKRILKCRLECGLEATVDADMIPPARFEKKESGDFHKGEVLIARIIEISIKVQGKDVFFNINLSLLPEDIENHGKFFKLTLDESFVIDVNDWEERAIFENEYKNRQKYVPRIALHPKFKNIGLKTACEELANKDIGECIFRPSSRGEDHLTCSWKFYNLVYSHLDINEEGKPAINMLGVKFRISNDTFDSLQEIIDKYIDPCVNLLTDAINHAKFKDSILTGTKKIENLIVQEKRARPTSIPYYFTICLEYPQYLVLFYMPKEEIITEFIKVKPKGLFFHEAYHPNINFLFSWFKRHYSDRSYKNQLERSKPPVIDSNTYLNFSGKTPVEEVINDENFNPNIQQSLLKTKPYNKKTHINLQEWSESMNVKNALKSDDCQMTQNYNASIEKTPAKDLNENKRILTNENNSWGESSNHFGDTKTTNNVNWGQAGNSGDSSGNVANNSDWGSSNAANNSIRSWGNAANNNSVWGNLNAWNSTENNCKDTIPTSERIVSGDRGCRKCGKDGHIARDCTYEKNVEGKRNCFKCGQPGHVSKECRNLSVDKSNERACFNCGQAGHISKECPNEKKSVNGDCFKCGKPGHKSKDCPNRKSVGDDCFSCGKSGHKSKECPNKKTQGGECFNCGQPGHISKECPNKKPNSDNCFNCGQTGHKSKDCTNEKISAVRSDCFKCGQPGHKSKDCLNDKKSTGGGDCFNCGQSGHKSKDCTKERNTKSNDCFNCGKPGHKSKDCPNEKKSSGDCFSCGQPGHRSKDCPNKKKSSGDCFNCGQPGHRSKDCPNPKKEKSRGSREQSREGKRENKSENSGKFGEDSSFGAWGSNSGNNEMCGWGNQGGINNINNSSWGNSVNSSIPNSSGWHNSSSTGGFSNTTSNGGGWGCSSNCMPSNSNGSWGDRKNNSGW